MKFNDVKVEEVKEGSVVLFAGVQQTITKKEKTMYGNDWFITLSVSGTGVWGKSDRITTVN